jgi:hypothetical protein
MEKLGVHEREPTAGYLVKHTETGEYFDISGPEYEFYDEQGLAGIYEHHKSTPDDPKFYEVDFAVQSQKTGECFVIYRPLYETGETRPSARPLDMFMDTVVVDGHESARFQSVRREM